MPGMDAVANCSKPRLRGQLLRSPSSSLSESSPISSSSSSSSSLLSAASSTRPAESHTTVSAGLLKLYRPAAGDQVLATVVSDSPHHACSSQPSQRWLSSSCLQPPAALQQKCAPVSIGSVLLSAAVSARPAEGCLASGGSWLAALTSCPYQTRQQSGASHCGLTAADVGACTLAHSCSQLLPPRTCCRQPRQWPAPTHPATASCTYLCWLAEARRAAAPHQGHVWLSLPASRC